ncbi:MAG: hypothetical protein A3D40_01685 [Parcubacteria group bacterium RIFCSPHIGHO2_02_FULL_40_12]|nr:MAG: hypothetical protein A3D40_01685 [Parcubacteria group bacterium RIFCSPHIGHO2_02_FULL_40_12]
MLSKDLQELISTLGGLLIVENGRPEFVVLTYDKYKGLIIPATLNSGVIHKNIDNFDNFDKDKDSNEEIIDRLNKEISALKEQVAERERELSGNL